MKKEFANDLERRLKKCDELWQRRLDNKIKAMASANYYEVYILQYQKSKI